MPATQFRGETHVSTRFHCGNCWFAVLPACRAAQQSIEASAETTTMRSKPAMPTTATKKLAERVEVETPFNFEDLVAAFERQLGHYDKSLCVGTPPGRRSPRRWNE